MGFPLSQQALEPERAPEPPPTGEAPRPPAPSRAAAVTLRQLNRRCGPLTGATTVQIQALPLEQLEALAACQAGNS